MMGLERPKMGKKKTTKTTTTKKKKKKKQEKEKRVGRAAVGSMGRGRNQLGGIKNERPKVKRRREKKKSERVNCACGTKSNDHLPMVLVFPIVNHKLLVETLPPQSHT